MFAYILSFIFVAVLAVYLYLSKKSQSDDGPKIPGPFSLPIIGSSYLLDNKTSPFIHFTKLAEKFGDIYSLPLGATKCIVVSSVANIKSVLLQNGKFFTGRPNFMRYNKLFDGNRKNSLALCDYDDLQARRRYIARRHCDPRKFSHINQIVSDVGVLECKEFVKTLNEKAVAAERSGDDMDLKPIIMATCLNMFCQYMCSIRFDMNDTEFLEVVHLFDEIFWEINQGCPADFFPWLLPFYKSHMDKLENWSKTIRKFILTRIINNRETNLDDDEEEKDFTDALLKILREEENATETDENKTGKFTRDAILFTLEDFLGGAAAVGNTVMIALSLLAKNPEFAHKIREEVENLTGGNRLPTVLDNDYLPQTVATIKEVLRYQSSPVVPHVAVEPGKIGEYTIEKGTVIFINNYKVNMDEKLWDEPSKFNPDRFLNKTYVEVCNSRRGSDQDSGVESENEDNNKSKFNNLKKTDSKYGLIDKSNAFTDSKMMKKEIVSLKQNVQHFMPFSIGKRSCLGQGLLMKYSTTLVATIVQNFDISCKRPENIKLYSACIALPPQSFGLTLTQRID